MRGRNGIAGEKMATIDFVDYNSADYQNWLLTLAPEDRSLMGEMSLTDLGNLNDEQIERRKDLRQNYLKGKLIEVVKEVKEKRQSEKESKQAQEDEKTIRYNIAAELMQEYIFKATRDTGEIFYYVSDGEDEGTYAPVQSLIHEEIQTRLGKDATPKAKIDIINYIQDSPGVRIDRPEFDGDSNLIHFNNCWYNITAKETYPHSPDRLSLTKNPNNYIPSQKSTYILKFLGKMLKPVDVFHMMQIAGHILYPSNRFEKMHAFLGGGGNGKGKMAEILAALAGEKTQHIKVLHS